MRDVGTLFINLYSIRWSFAYTIYAGGVFINVQVPAVWLAYLLQQVRRLYLH